MLGTFVDVHLVEHLTTQAILRQHTANGVLNYVDGLLVQYLTRGLGALTTRVTGVGDVFLLVELLARETYLLSIDHDDVVTVVVVRSIVRLVFATQDVRDAAGQTAYDFTFGVDDVPLALDRLLVGRFSLITQRIHFIAL